MKILRKILMLILASMIVFSGCTVKEEVSETEPASSEMVEKKEKPVIHLAGTDTGLPNPFRHLTRGPGFSKMQLLYDSLLEIDSEGYIPWLAKSYSVDDSKLTYSFELVDNAYWHDGKPLTVADVIFTFDYYKKHKPVSDNLNVNGKYIVSSVEETGEKSFDIKVNASDNTYLAKIGGVRILPKHIWENVEDPISYQGEGATVGSGPFKMISYDPTKGEYRYEAVEAYWGLEPAVKAIEWIPASDSVLAFENGDIDLINASADIISRYEASDEFTVKNLPSYHSYRLMMNMEKNDLLKDVKIRQALAYGIDRNELIEKIARGAADISSMGYVPSTSKWFNPNIEKYIYNAEKSKELLDEKTIEFKLLTGNTPQEVKLAELIKINLEKVGVNLLIQSVESKTRDEAVKTGEYELLLINSGGMGADPDYLRNIYATDINNTTALHSATLKGYYNPELVSLAKKQAEVNNDELRKEYIFEMQKIIAQEVPMIMLYSNHDNFVYRHDYYDGWYARFDHSKLDHNKLSYLIRDKND